MITIFTPSFNRSQTLTRLYESLLNQTDKDFEWVIVDDGSKDDTEYLIQNFKKENLLKIRYFFQENQGKHIAINKGVAEAKGNYFLTIDSDDYLLENAVETCKKLISEIRDKPNFAGFTYIHFQEGTPFDKERYGQKRWTQEEKYIWEFHGEMAFCYKTEILQKFPFPQFPNEKFCPESLIHHRIGNHYKILYTDNVLASGNYLPEGLSTNFLKLLETNPRTSMLLYAEKLRSPEFDKETKDQFLKNYWNVALKAKHISWKEKFGGVPFVLSARFWKKRFFG